MRPLSKKRQAEKRKADPLRKVFREEFPACWVCRHRADDIHEMTPGPSRGRAYSQRATWLRLCRKCHERLQAFSKPFDLAGQLALKAKWDIEHYDRLLVIEIKLGRVVDTHVTESEVLTAAWSLQVMEN